jgi:hypothetical protein
MVDLSFAGQEEEELREYVAELITSQMNSESFHLKPQQVTSTPHPGTKRLPDHIDPPPPSLTGG